ncbi:lectin-like domain-containing protein [Curtobacterium sp. L1-20]|uniref:lectin-like domain-containing protein n=1 Tax=Curtobacterium sp. L1-20 TaxID=3138181 RepID=UPI003B52D18E
MREPNTPPAGRPPARARTARRAIALAGVLTAIGVLAAPVVAASPSTAGELDFPYAHQFDSADGGSLSGDAVVTGGRLRLTDDVRNQAGSWSTDDTFRSDRGLEIEFAYAMHNDVDDPGADGLLLSLSDGAAAQGVGAYGAALGYACRSSTNQGGGVPCDLPGMPGGFAAVALDHYGNFSLPLNQSGPGAQEQFVVVRGSGDGVSGYRYVDGVRAPGGTATEGARTRTVRVTLQPGDAGELFVTVRIDAGGGLRPVLERVPLHGDGQASLPSTLRLGFAAATGSHVDVHEVDALRVWQPADLAVEHDLAPTVTAGDTVTYSVTARNVGANPSAPSALDVDVPDALQDVTWTCAPTGGAGTSCGTPSGTGDVEAELDLPRGGAATVAITGRLPEGAAGPLDSIAQVEPAPALADVDETDNVSTASAVVDPGAGPAAHVWTDKSVAPATGVAPGDEVEYLVTAHNRGPAVAQDVGAVDELPAAMRFVGSDDGCTAAGQVVTCTSGTSLDAGASTSFRIRAVLDPAYEGDGSDVVNVATATSPTDPDGGDPSAEVDIAVVVPGGDDGPADDGAGGGDPGDGGPGDGGPGDPAPGDGPAGAQPAADASAAPHGARRRGELAFTGAEGLGLVAALGAGAAAVGGAVWWGVRRRSRERGGARTS